MAAQFTRWQRRDAGDRAEMAEAALQLCRASRNAGAHSSRYFWTSPDAIAVVTEVDMAAIGAMDTDASVAAALFALGDTAAATHRELWNDPREGVSNYAAAGRI